MRSIARKGSVLVAVPALFQVVLLTGILVMEGERNTARRTQERLDASLRTCLELTEALVEVESGARAYVLTGDSSFAERSEEAARRAASLLPRAAALLNDQEAEAASLIARANAILAFQRSQVALVASGRSDEAVARSRSLEGYRRMMAFRSELDRNVDRQWRRFHQTASDRAVLRKRSIAVMTAGVAANIVLAIALAFYFRRQIGGRLDDLVGNISRFERGEVLHASQDDIGEIAAVDRALHVMAAKRELHERVLVEHADRQAAIIAFEHEVARHAHSPERVTAVIAERVRELAGGDGAAILRVEDDTLTIEAAAGDIASLTGTQVPRVRSLWSEAHETGRVVRSDDIQHDPRVHPEMRKRFGGRAVLLVPLRYGEETLGILGVGSRQPARFADEHEQTLQLVAGFLGAVLMQARMFRERERVIEERTAEIRKLNAELENRVAETTSELDHFFSLSLDLMCVAGYDGCFKRLNPAWTGTLGWSSGELMAKPFIEFVHPDDRERTIAEASRLMEGNVTLSFQNRYLARDGAWHWLEWTAAGVQEQRRIYAVARDVTQRRQFEEELKEKNAALEEAYGELESFSYSVSHDLRAPIRAMDGYARMLLEDHGDRLDDEGRRFVTTIIESARSMGTLIDDLLRLSRLGRQPLSLAPTDMTALVAEVWDEIRKDLPAEEVRLILHELPPALADRNLVRQVMVNLLSNAVKFTAPKPERTIEVGGSAGAGFNRYFVRDNGVGFEQKYAAMIFGAFQRLHGRRFEGTGVGLAIVKRVIEKHGGEIHAEGRPGEGATIAFTLPQGAM
ncbi:MAG TPA: ATP-binding protein [Thermoanaerobaculia bacterium]|nr:ATP-binding protein [Thermoanaerobaculia bacterium]